MKKNYRKGTFEARMDELLPEYEFFSLQFFELWREPEGGWSVNDSWMGMRNVSRDMAIEGLRGRWEVFKVNYLSKARVSDICDESSEEDECRLEVDYTSFCTVTFTSKEEES